MQCPDGGTQRPLRLSRARWSTATIKRSQAQVFVESQALLQFFVASDVGGLGHGSIGALVLDAGTQADNFIENAMCDFALGELGKRQVAAITGK